MGEISPSPPAPLPMCGSGAQDSASTPNPFSIATKKGNKVGLFYSKPQVVQAKTAVGAHGCAPVAHSVRYKNPQPLETRYMRYTPDSSLGNSNFRNNTVGA